MARVGDKVLAGSEDDYRWRPQGIFAIEEAKRREIEDSGEDKSRVMAEIPEVDDDRDDDAGDIIQSEQETTTETKADSEGAVATPILAETPAAEAPKAEETQQPSEQKDTTAQSPDIDPPNP